MENLFIMTGVEVTQRTILTTHLQIEVRKLKNTSTLSDEVSLDLKLERVEIYENGRLVDIEWNSDQAFITKNDDLYNELSDIYRKETITKIM